MNGKPSWDDAPLWAQWLAMDDDGRWFWHESEPRKGAKEWITVSGSVDCAGKIDWKETLEGNPGATTMSARDTQVGGDHYKDSQYQPWDVLPEWLDGWSPFQAYLLGNILKYLYRAPRKGDRLNDLRKAQHYLAHLIEHVEADLESSQDALPPRAGDQFP